MLVVVFILSDFVDVLFLNSFKISIILFVCMICILQN